MTSKHNSKLSGNFNRIPSSYIREILNVASQQNIISFAGGLPNPDFFPNTELSISAKFVLENQGKEVLQYAGSQGYLPLREWIASRYSDKYDMHIKPENIVITNGSQQTIDVTSKMFLNPGDGVIVEKPTYLGGIQAMAGYSPTFLGVDLNNDGPDVEQIEQHCLNHVPKFMYSIPNFQNPSGICYSKEKRENISELISNYNLLVLEDDPYNEIRFEGEDLNPIFNYCPDQVFWSGSFSKMVAPGLRLGWVVLPDGIVNQFIKAKQSTDLHSNNLSQFVLHHYLTNNNIDDHLHKIRHAYKQQCEYMQQMIQHFLPDDIETTKPKGGMFLWLTLPKYISADKLASDCLQNGVAIVPGGSFYTGNNQNSNLRLNFSNSSEANLEKGIKIIGQLIKKEALKVVSLVS